MNQKNKFKCVSPKGIKNADEQPYTGIFLNILSTVINCTSVKRFCKSFSAETVCKTVLRKISEAQIMPADSISPKMTVYFLKSVAL